MAPRGPKPNQRDEALTPKTRKLVEGCHDLAIKIAWDFWKNAPNQIYEISDLVSVATWGLVDAGLRWNPYCAENNYSPEDTNYFVSFAARSVQGELRDYSRTEDFVTRAVRDEAREIINLLGTGKSRDEAAVVLGLTPGKVGTTLAAVASTPWSLDDDSLLDESARETIESEADVTNLLDAFAEIIEGLPYNAQAVLALRYYAGVEMADIARYLNLTASAVLKLHTDSLTAVKERMELAAAVMG